MQEIRSRRKTPLPTSPAKLAAILLQLMPILPQDDKEKLRNKFGVQNVGDVFNFIHSRNSRRFPEIVVRARLALEAIGFDLRIKASNIFQYIQKSIEATEAGLAEARHLKDIAVDQFADWTKLDGHFTTHLSSAEVKERIARGAGGFAGGKFPIETNLAIDVGNSIGASVPVSFELPVAAVAQAYTYHTCGTGAETKTAVSMKFPASKLDVHVTLEFATIPGMLLPVLRGEVEIPGLQVPEIKRMVAELADKTPISPTARAPRVSTFEVHAVPSGGSSGG